MGALPGCIITDYAVTMSSSGVVSPLVGSTVKAAFSLTPLFVKQDDNSYRQVESVIQVITAAGTGQWSVTLPSQGNCDPNTETWTITLPDGTAWNGIVTAAMVTASQTTALTIHDLKTMYGWGLLAGAAGGIVNAVQGPTGPVGPVGATWRGAWSSSATYAVNDAVSSAGSSYVCILGNMNQAPPNATYWLLLSQVGATGATGATGPAAAAATFSVAGSVRQTVYNVKDYGALGDGATNDTAAINAAIAAANTAGGGIVTIPTGAVYMASGIKIKNNVALHVPRGAVVRLLPTATNSLILNDDQAGGNSALFIYGGGEIDANQANLPQTNGQTAPTAPTAGLAAAASGVDLGAHTYVATFSGLYGETLQGGATAITVTSGNQQVNLSAIQVGPNGGGSSTTARKLYRSKAGTTTPLYLLATIADNTTTTYTDTTADSALGAAIQTVNTSSMSAISFQKVSSFIIEDVYVHDARQTCVAIDFNCTQGRIARVRGDVAGNDVFIAHGGSSDIIFESCIATNAGGVLTPLPGGPNRTGFEASDDCRAITFTGCISEANADDGFGINNHGSADPQGNTGGPYGVALAGCHAHNNGTTNNPALGAQVTGHGYGFHIFAQGSQGPDAVALSSCTATGGVEGFRTEETRAGAVLGNVTMAACVAGSYFTSGAFTSPETATIGVANSPSGNCFTVYGGGRSITLSGCVAEAAGTIGFAVLASPAANAHSVTLSGCTSRGSGSYGINVNGVPNCKLLGCTSDGATNYGIYIQGASTRTRLVNCHADNGTAGGFVVASGSDDSILTGCYAYNNAGNGFLIQANRPLLSGCDASGQTGTTGQGYVINVGVGATLNGCNAVGNSKDGLLITGSSAINHISVVGGQYLNNGTAFTANYGIRIASTPDSLLIAGVIATGNTSAPSSSNQIVTTGATNVTAVNTITT